jgi:hypothetical protein
MEEEEFQSQLMARGHYMIDEDESSNPHHEHVQATTTLESEDVVEEIANEPSLKDPLEESCAQFKFVSLCLATFCWTKSLLCNDAYYLGMLVHSESTSQFVLQEDFV